MPNACPPYTKIIVFYNLAQLIVYVIQLSMYDRNTASIGSAWSRQKKPRSLPSPHAGRNTRPFKPNPWPANDARRALRAPAVGSSFERRLGRSIVMAVPGLDPGIDPAIDASSTPWREKVGKHIDKIRSLRYGFPNRCIEPPADVRPGRKEPVGGASALWPQLRTRVRRARKFFYLNRP